MNKPGEIRVIVLGLIQDGDRLFVSEGYDPVKQQTFYRALGGGVDFGETSHAALQREFHEYSLPGLFGKSIYLQRSTGSRNYSTVSVRLCRSQILSTGTIGFFGWWGEEYSPVG